MKRRASVFGLFVLSLAAAACGGSETTTSPIVQEAWNDCQSVDFAQDLEGTYAGIKPDGATLPITLETVSVSEDPGSNSVTFTGSIDGVSFRCVYNTFAKISAVDWWS